MGVLIPQGKGQLLQIPIEMCAIHFGQYVVINILAVYMITMTAAVFAVLSYQF